jgi:hypothetical protein
MVGFAWLADLAAGRPPRDASAPRDVAAVLAFGLAAMAANLYLVIGAATGRSIGKVLTGLRLVVLDDAGEPVRPGIARGLVRAACQAGPWMGALMVLTGVHDRLAGTTLVRAGAAADIPPDAGAGVAAWRVVVAIAAHLAAGAVYMFVGAL